MNSLPISKRSAVAQASELEINAPASAPIERHNSAPAELQGRAPQQGNIGKASPRRSESAPASVTAEKTPPKMQSHTSSDTGTNRVPQKPMDEAYEQVADKYGSARGPAPLKSELDQ